MVPTTPASQPLLLRHHVSFHRRRCSGTKAHAVPAHAGMPPTAALPTPLAFVPFGATCPASSPRRLCTASSCLESITATARSPGPHPPFSTPRTRGVWVPARVPPLRVPCSHHPGEHLIPYPAPNGLASFRKALHSLPECAGVCTRLPGVWSSPGSAAASDLSDDTGGFFSIGKRRYLLAGKAATLTEKAASVRKSRHLPVGETWRLASSRRVIFLGFSPLIPAVW